MAKRALLAALVMFALGLCAGGVWAKPSFGARLAAAAEKRTKADVTYDGRYFTIAYPGGDVPAHLGVCTDVLVRSYRALGLDLQRLVHEDMTANFALYPKSWGLTRPDTNIDHRRVPNLRVFFARQGVLLPVTGEKGDYKPGDIVTWNIANWWRTALKGRKHIPHIGIVSDRTAPDGTPLIVHNIGAGPRLENMLFTYEITGHYRYEG